MVKIIVNVPDNLLDKLESHKTNNYYTSRNALLVEAIRDFLKNEG